MMPVQPPQAFTFLPDPSFGSLLRGLREARGFSQERFAARIGYGGRTLRRWEADEAVPDSAAEAALIAFCSREALFRRYDNGPLAGLVLSAEALGDLLAGARMQLRSRTRRLPAATPDTPVSRSVALGLREDSPPNHFPRSQYAAALPSPVTRFFGRNELVDDVTRLLQESRLVTLTGPGGVGKTRLALEAARHMAAVQASLRSPQPPIDCALVSLAPVRDPALVGAAIAGALGVPESPGRSLLIGVCEALQAHPSLLLLDNWEHLLPAAPIVSMLLAACPELRVLATSRAALRLSGEHEIEVPPLPLPASDGGHEANNDALRLFADRARAVRPDFVLTGENVAAVAAICRRLDGLPLAIELAAARVRFLPPRSLLEQLDQRLRLLRDGPRDLPPRQQTLRNTIAWSYELLTLDGQGLFQRLAAFTGDFSLRAAGHFSRAISGAANDVIETIGALVEQSLLRQELGPDGEPRFAMLETVREFAEGELVRCGGLPAARRAHAEAILRSVEDTQTLLRTGHQAMALACLEADHENLRAALHWCVDERAVETGLRLVRVLHEFWRVRGHLGEGRSWVEALLALLGEGADEVARAMLLTVGGTLAFYQGDYITARAQGEAGLALARQSGDEPSILEGLNVLGGLVLHGLGAFGAARALLEEALPLARRLQDRVGVVQTLNHLGNVARDAGDGRTARGYYDEALTISRDLGNDYGIALELNHLGLLAFAEGDDIAAETLLRESLAGQEELRARWDIARTLIRLANVALHRGDVAQAEALIAESLDIFSELGERWGIALCLATRAHLALERADLRQAARDFGESLRLRYEIGERIGIAESLEGLAGVLDGAAPLDLIGQLRAAAVALSSSGRDLPHNRADERGATRGEPESAKEEDPPADPQGAALGKLVNAGLAAVDTIARADGISPAREKASPGS